MADTLASRQSLARFVLPFNGKSAELADSFPLLYLAIFTALVGGCRWCFCNSFPASFPRNASRWFLLTSCWGCIRFSPSAFRLLHAACRMPLRVAQSAQLLCIFLLKSRVSADWKAFCNVIFYFYFSVFLFSFFFAVIVVFLVPFSLDIFTFCMHALCWHIEIIYFPSSIGDCTVYTFYAFYSDRSDELRVSLLFKKYVRETMKYNDNNN